MSPDSAESTAVDPAADPAPQTGSGDVGGPDDVGSLRREAASYRSRLRATESERDTLAERVTAYHRTTAEALASGGSGRQLHDGKDLWTAGVELGELLDEAGAVDPARVAAAVGTVLDARPHWSARTASFDGGARDGGTAAPKSLGEELFRVT